MWNVDQTKLRLIDEAIQENLHRQRPRSKTQEPEQPRRHISVWLWGIPFLAILVYLAAPTGFAYRAKSSVPLVSVEQKLAVSRPADPPTAPTVPTASNPQPEIPKAAAVPYAAPRPLNRALFPLSIKKLVIHAGHGGTDHGTNSDTGVSEKDITLDIALRLRRLLEEASFEVLMTRETDDAVPLEKRAQFANLNSADVFISIHVNSMQPGTLRALETYFLGPTDDPATMRLLATENRESTYALSDYRRLLDKIYIDARLDESHSFAKSIQTELYRSLKQINHSLEDRGVKTAPFIVLTRTNMPAILVEVSCLSNEDEVKLLTDPDYKESIAQALLAGIRSYASKLNGSEEKVAKNGRDE
jgi:N-acetylmuramoyl-L-alanine amidase